jgi:hypothetical protein
LCNLQVVHFCCDKKSIQKMFYPKKNTSIHKGAAMKRYRKQMPSDQVYIPETSGLKTKCVTLLVYEEQGKTVLQPLATEQETSELQELFQNSTLEVWLSNGKNDADNFDVSILKYKSQLQQSTFSNASNSEDVA